MYRSCIRLAAGVLLASAAFTAAAAGRGSVPADLSITKTDGTDQAMPGSSVTYTIVAANAGPSNATARVSDTFPAVCVSANYTCSGAGGGTCTALGSSPIDDLVSLPAGASVTYTASCGIDAAAPAGQLVNTATIAPGAGIIDSDMSNNSATDTDVLGDQPDIMMSITDNRTTIGAGGQLTYGIRAMNIGTAPISGVTISDTFPSACVPSGWTCASAGGGTCPASGSGDINALVDLQPGGSILFVARCVVPQNETPGTIVSNTATAIMPPGVAEIDSGNNSATDTTTVIGVADISATKTASGTFTIGSQVTYTVVINNHGAGAQADNAGDEFTDYLDPNLQLVTAVASSGSVTTDPSQGRVSWNGAIPAGGSVTITITATILPAATGTISNLGVIVYDSDANNTNNRQVFTDDPTRPGTADPTEFVVNIPTRLSAEMTAFHFGQGYVPGGTLYYTVLIRNTGNLQADNPGDEFVDVLPAGVRVLNVQAPVGTAVTDNATNTVRWNGSVPANGLVSFTIVAEIGVSTVGTVSNQGTLNYDSNGDGSNDTVVLSDDPGQPGTSDPTVITVVAVPTRVAATKGLYGNQHPRGKALIYTINMQNFGSLAQADNPGDEMVDVLPRGVDFIRLETTSGTATYDPATRRVSWNGSIAPYGAAVVNIFVVVSADASGLVNNQATLYFDADSNGSNESSALTHDPSLAGANRPTGFTVLAPVPGPGLPMLTLLGLGLLLLGRYRLRSAAMVR